MISVKNLTYDYPGKRALDNISFEIEQGSITALVGPNGAGKTTLLRCLAALDNWTLGDLYIDDIEVEENPRDIHKICSYLSDFFGLYDDLSVEKSLKFIAMSRGVASAQLEKQCQEAARRLNILEFYDKDVSQLSRGQRQRVAIAQTVVVPPKVLILDEPASGLDPSARFSLSQQLMELQKQGMTILVSSHILSELEDYSTHMLMIEDGRITKHCALSHEQTQTQVYKLVLSEDIETYQEKLEGLGITLVQKQGQQALISLSSELNPKTLLQTLVQEQIPVESFSAEKQSMQQVYMSSSQQPKGDDDA